MNQAAEREERERDANMQYARALKVARATRGLTQLELSQKSGVNRSQLALVESGKREPGLRVLEQLATALDLPLYLLMLIASEDDDLKGIDQAQASALGATLLGLVTATETTARRVPDAPIDEPTRSSTRSTSKSARRPRGPRGR